jgi:hypothetical protein
VAGQDIATSASQIQHITFFKELQYKNSGHSKPVHVYSMFSAMFLSKFNAVCHGQKPSYRPVLLGLVKLSLSFT